MQSKLGAPVLVAMLLLIHSACENDFVEEYEPELNVFSVLNAFETQHRVIVDRTYTMDEPSGGLIEDAFVVLSGHDWMDTLVFSYGTGNYHSDPFFIAPLDTCELMVAREGLDTLTGVTVIPGYFTIVSPAHYDTVTLQDTIVITKSEHAALYSCFLHEDVTGYGTFFWHEPDPFDSLIQIPMDQYLDFFPTGYFTLYVVAYDPSCYEYYFASGDTAQQAGVTGGVGLFGSTCGNGVFAYMTAQ